MILLPSRRLAIHAAAHLHKYQSLVDMETSFARRVVVAASTFKRHNQTRNRAFREVRNTLTIMCAGARRCMYCEDSVADEVEHHRPKNLYPAQTFVWENYLYACGSCNRPKSDHFPVFLSDGSVSRIRGAGRLRTPPPAGDAVMLHPRTENALDFMTLDIAGDTFLFVPTAPLHSRDYIRAEITVDILRLNTRDYLAAARREAYESYRARLTEYIHQRDAGVGPVALRRLVRAIRAMQHPTVWKEMCRQQSHIPELAKLFLQAPEALSW